MENYIATKNGKLSKHIQKLEGVFVQDTTMLPISTDNFVTECKVNTWIIASEPSIYLLKSTVRPYVNIVHIFLWKKKNYYSFWIFHSWTDLSASSTIRCTFEIYLYISFQIIESHTNSPISRSCSIQFIDGSSRLMDMTLGLVWLLRVLQANQKYSFLWKG